jgi:hypothetical protein
MAGRVMEPAAPTTPSPGGIGWGFGGGIYGGDPLTVTDCVLSGTSAMGNTAFEGNGYGGGIYGRDTVTVIGSSLSGNSARSINGYSSGGGIYETGRAALTVSGCTLTYAYREVSMRQLARELNEKGIAGTQGKTWRSEVAGILKNPIYAGGLCYGRRQSGKYYRLAGGEIVEAEVGAPVQKNVPAPIKWGVFPAIIDRPLPELSVKLLLLTVSVPTL